MTPTANRIVFAFWAAVSSSAHAVFLPSYPAGPSGADQGTATNCTGKWWFRVSDRIYVEPPASLMELGQNVSDYYLAVGSPTAFTPLLKQQHVGGDGRKHIFYLPHGVRSTLRMPIMGDRRNSLSSLVQLSAGTVVKSQFDPFLWDASIRKDNKYDNKLDDHGMKTEKFMVNQVSEHGMMKTLAEIVNLGYGEEKYAPLLGTRAWDNEDASEIAVKFLNKKFKTFGFENVCKQTWGYYHNGKDIDLTNVMAYSPGTGGDKLVVVGAHYDSRPFESESKGAPGAEDNGSGLTGLLAMADAFSKAKATHKNPVIFVGFAAEELGLIGSTEFVKDLVANKLPKECMPAISGHSSFLQSGTRRTTGGVTSVTSIIMDEIGWVKAGEYKTNMETRDGSMEKDMMKHMADANFVHNTGKLQLEHSSNPFGSDHMAFLGNNCPSTLNCSAVLTINTGDSDYKAYHTDGDTISMVNATLMYLTTRMNIGALARQAEIGQQGH